MDFFFFSLFPTLLDRLVEENRISVPIDHLAFPVEPHRQVSQVSADREEQREGWFTRRKAKRRSWDKREQITNFVKAAAWTINTVLLLPSWTTSTGYLSAGLSMNGGGPEKKDDDHFSRDPSRLAFRILFLNPFATSPTKMCSRKIVVLIGEKKNWRQKE